MSFLQLVEYTGNSKENMEYYNMFYSKLVFL